MIAGRCGGREAWTTPPCKGYLWYTDPGAPASCRVHARRRHSAENIQSDVCVEITVSGGAVTIEVSQSVNQRNRKRGGGGNENKEDSSLFFLNIIFINIPSSYTDNHCQCSTWSLVSRQLLPEGSATRASPLFRQMLSDCRAFKHDSCVSLTCIKCPRPPWRLNVILPKKVHILFIAV